MSHYAPIKAATADQFPHMAKGHASSLEESLSVAAEACRGLGDSPLLFRVHHVKGKTSGVVVVTADPEGWRRGRMGLTAKIDPKYESFMVDLTSSLDLSQVVYTSFGKGRHDFGSASIFVPLSPRKIVWNPEVSDIYVTFKERMKKGESMDDVIEGYRGGWPSSAPLGTEVIVDVDRYMLLSPEILKHTLFYRDKESAAALDKVKTYSDLADVISPGS